MNGSTPPFAASCDCNVPQAITSASRGIDRAGAESGARYVVLVSDPERARASVYDNDGDDPPDDHTPRTVHRPPVTIAVLDMTVDFLVPLPPDAPIPRTNTPALLPARISTRNCLHCRTHTGKCAALRSSAGRAHRLAKSSPTQPASRRAGPLR